MTDIAHELNLEMQAFTLAHASETEVDFQTALKNGDAAIVGLCIQAGADPSANDNYAIQYASQNGHVTVVDRLLQDPRVDPQGLPVGYLCVTPSTLNNNAIRTASLNGHVAVVERLLQDPRVDTRGVTCRLPVGYLCVTPSADDNFAIRTASQSGNIAVVDRLLQDGGLIGQPPVSVTDNQLGR